MKSGHLSLKGVIFGFLIVFAASAQTESKSKESPLVAEARELLDTYYGNSSILQKASALLQRAYEQNPKDANLYVQSGRLVVKGGHISYANFQSGTFETYGALLDKAISLDKNNKMAHALKAEVFQYQKNYPAQLAELKKAKAIGPMDSWLQIGFAEYYCQVKQMEKCWAAYHAAMESRPVETPSQKRAYIASLDGLRRYFGSSVVSDLEMLRSYAIEASKVKYPTDAWTPQGYAESFLFYQDFDNAILYARDALKTMDFGAGRLTLVGALYAKAAQISTSGGSNAQIEVLVKEAERFGFQKPVILDYLLVKRDVGLRFPNLKQVLNRIVRDTPNS